MGIFDVFKSKVSEAADKAGDVAGKAWDKAGDVAGEAKDKVSDMMDKKKGDQAGGAAPTWAQTPAPANTESGVEGRASDMVSEGGPVATAGEAAPGAGDDGALPQDSSGSGMTQSIKDNTAQAADKAESGVRQAKDRMS